MIEYVAGPVDVPRGENAGRRLDRVGCMRGRRLRVSISARRFIPSTEPFREFVVRSLAKWRRPRIIGTQSRW